MRTFVLSLLAFTAIASAASADPIPNGAGDFSSGFGMGWDNFDTPINPSTRDENGNRTIVNGRMEIEGALTGGLQGTTMTFVVPIQAARDLLKAAGFNEPK